jgi:c-di-GMP-binding flagellar brake protein YcgR
MNEPEVLKDQKITSVLEQTASQQCPAVVSFLTKGKWHMLDAVFTAVSEKTVHINIQESQRYKAVTVQIDQPVGISFRLDSDKYIFESKVLGYECGPDQQCQGRIILDLPERVEKMQRRAYSRATVPDSLNVAVNFWHRGYVFDCQEVPVENCWQGELVDLSAGGLQISITAEQAPNFREGQVIGMQFTPLSYEKPLSIEGQVRHIAQTADQDKYYLGVEFLGLETTMEGREKLQRIVNTVTSYQENSSKPLKEPLFGLADEIKSVMGS